MQDISLAVKVDKRQVKDLKTLIGQVEKQVGTLNKVKINLDTTKAVKDLEALERSAKKLINALGKPGGIRAVKNSLSEIAKASGKVGDQFRRATTAAERQSAALGVLALRFKALREEGRSLVRGGAGQTAKGQGMGLTGQKGSATGAAGSIENIIKDLSDLPRTLAASKQQFAEIDLLLENSVAGSKAFNLLAKARKNFLERELVIREQIKRQQTPMPADPFGTKVPLLPAAGQTSGTFSIQERNAELAEQTLQAAAEKLRIEKLISKENINQAETTRATARKRLDNIRKIRRRRKGQRLNETLLGAGFPLLFGGGIGAVGGSLLGGALAAPFGAAFGGQIFGSAIGQALDQAAQAANQFAIEATKAGTSIGTLIQAFGIRGTGAARTLGFAGTLGIGAAARQAAGGSLESIVGKDGVGNLEKLAQSSEDASNALDRFGASTTSFFAPLLTAVNQGVAGLFGGISPLEQQRRAQESLENLPARGRGTAARRNRLNTRIAQISASPEAKAQLELEEKISQVVSSREKMARDSTRVEAMKLTARRDSLAFEQGTLQVQAEQNKLLVLGIQRQAEKNEEKQRELDLEINITEEAKRRAEAARNNAVIQARRQIQREQISGAANQIKAIRQEQRLELQYQQGREGRFALFAQEKKQLDAEFLSNGLILELERKRALIGVTEEERISSINRDYDLRVRLLEKEFQLNKQRAQQQYAEYQLGRLQVAQALDLQKIQAGMDAQRKIRETSPFARQSFLTDPFFGSSRELAANQAANFDQQVGMMQFQLGQNETQLNQAIADQAAPARIKALEDQRARLELSLATYREFTPAVDEAALAQARFNDAMAITVPITNSLYDNLVSVVEGTKTAREAFADFLRSIASMLADAAKQIIATYIAIGIARMFAGVPAAKSAPAPDIQSGAAFNLPKQIMVGGMRTAASGKGALMNQPYLVGERGPELFVPKSNGTIVPNHQMGASATVTVNVDASGSSVEGDSDQAAQLGRMLGAAVQAELVKQKRPGGLLAS